MPDCGVHYLWFAFVCFLIRSHPALRPVGGSPSPAPASVLLLVCVLGPHFAAAHVDSLAWPCRCAPGPYEQTSGHLETAVMRHSIQHQATKFTSTARSGPHSHDSDLGKKHVRQAWQPVVLDPEVQQNPLIISMDAEESWLARVWNGSTRAGLGFWFGHRGRRSAHLLGARGRSQGAQREHAEQSATQNHTSPPCAMHLHASMVHGGLRGLPKQLVALVHAMCATESGLELGHIGARDGIFDALMHFANAFHPSIRCCCGAALLLPQPRTSLPRNAQRHDHRQTRAQPSRCPPAANSCLAYGHTPSMRHPPINPDHFWIPIKFCLQTPGDPIGLQQSPAHKHSNTTLGSKETLTKAPAIRTCVALLTEGAAVFSSWILCAYPFCCCGVGRQKAAVADVVRIKRPLGLWPML